jgi:hypothetical protein
MALKQCVNCGHAFWCDSDANLCAMCSVAEKQRQAVEREKAAAREELQGVKVAVS